MRLTRRTLLTGLGAPAVLPLVPRRALPRVVSVNPCLDAILVHVANRSQIVALSHYSRIPQQSNIYEIARTLPVTHGTAEEIITLKPDFLLSTPFEPMATRYALERMGIPSHRFNMPESVTQSFEQVREIARLVGHPERGERLIGQINAALNAARPRTSRRIKALIYQPNGFAAGKGTMLNEMMERVGLENVAGDYGVGKWGNVPLEHLIMNPPELLLSGGASSGASSQSKRLMRHPALASLQNRIVQARFDERYLYCGGPVLIRTAQALARARDTALEQLS